MRFLPLPSMTSRAQPSPPVVYGRIGRPPTDEEAAAMPASVPFTVRLPRDAYNRLVAAGNELGLPRATVTIDAIETALAFPPTVLAQLADDCEMREQLAAIVEVLIGEREHRDAMLAEVARTITTEHADTIADSARSVLSEAIDAHRRRAVLDAERLGDALRARAPRREAAVA